MFHLLGIDPETEVPGLGNRPVAIAAGKPREEIAAIHREARPIRVRVAEANAQGVFLARDLIIVASGRAPERPIFAIRPATIRGRWAATNIRSTPAGAMRVRPTSSACAHGPPAARFASKSRCTA